MIEYGIEEVVSTVHEVEKLYKTDLRERLLDFSVNVIHFLSTINGFKEYDVFRYQLSKSATSIGANYEEAQTSTYKEFVNRIRIFLREASETLYWLRIIDRLNIGNHAKREELLQESSEITRIFGAILTKIQSR